MRLAKDITDSSTHLWALCILSVWKERGANYRPFLSLVNSLPTGGLCDVTAVCLDTMRQELLQLSPEYLRITILPEGDVC
jgi:hypothetical protein